LKCALLELLGEGYLLSDYSLNIVNPAQPIDDWHIDYPYNEMTHPVTGSALLGVQCVLAIDEFTAENGATQYIPLSREPSRVPNASTEHPYEQLEAVAGTLTIMAASTWHRSGYNASSLPRSAVLLSFVERWIRPMNDPPEPGPWSTSQELRMLLGLERPAETINGVAINGGTEL
jgi:ectoine hydroxylase-related dioxygenase (phytanoyl-CoA dioxygenase family)